MTDDINDLAKYRDRVLDDCWKLVDDTHRAMLREYIVFGDLAEQIPIKLRRAQEQLLEAVAAYETAGREEVSDGQIQML